mmetsp:Transcript_6554/g.16974  ORF Transcript_6554/g.16974 Transcript_6554/m.16974 type:complete len:204 (-) Transcript_6554:333-944(-)|eukprot:CAMPEP_0115852518 /NCGR_PEP_ID=MMETSP0287-20121206/13039_1 /TAXON_ID=412157 /ORGANISM="Chrysochromulina rotalis, Strain UIO044" /LENGTH=203 /DNA_ID=CAMNT_0003306585 /DNA_START=85 /DNA_END=696 /DNA_ORIENTATION=+
MDNAASLEMDKSSLVLIVTWALASAAICEGLAWLLVYRRDDYQRLNQQFTAASKRLERQKAETEDIPKGNKDKKDKKLVRLEKEFFYARRDAMAFRSRCNMLTAAFHAVTFFSLKTSYDGIILARLPFVPYGMVQTISHRNLPGNDMRDCGLILIYMLCSMAIKPNLAKALGHEPPQSAIPDTEQAAKMAERLMGSMGMEVPK